MEKTHESEVQDNASKFQAREDIRYSFMAVENRKFDLVPIHA